MPRKPRERKLEFELVPRKMRRVGTSKAKPTVQTRRPYVSRKPSSAEGRFVHRYSGFVQLETQRPLVMGDILRMSIIQGSESVRVDVHYKDGSVQRL